MTEEKRKPGRPKGSKNKPKHAALTAEDASKIVPLTKEEIHEAQKKQESIYQEASLSQWYDNLKLFQNKMGMQIFLVDDEEAKEVYEWMNESFRQWQNNKEPSMSKLKRWFNKFWPVRWDE